MADAAFTAYAAAKPLRRALLAASLLCSTALGVSAADWVADGGAQNGNWNNPNHWSGGSVPDAITPVVIGPTGALISVTDPSQAASVDILGGAQMILYSGSSLIVTDYFHADGNNVRVTVQSAGVYLDIRGTMTLGSVTSFSVEDDAELITRGAILGENAGQHALLDIINGATWDNSGRDIVVGQGGSASLNVYGGARVDTDNLTVGNGDARSDLDLGSGSTINASGTVTIGGLSEGHMDIVGGTVMSTSLIAGESAGSFGRISVRDSFNSDGVLFSFDTIRVGAAGTGEIVVHGGGRAGTLSGVVLGEAATGTGSLTVSEADSEFFADGNSDIGDDGIGVIVVEDSGRFIGNGYVNVGNGSSGQGTVTVTNAFWEQSAGAGALDVGVSGRGSFLLDNSEAEVNFLIVGDYQTGRGSVTLTNGSTMTVATSGATVGNEGEASLRVDGGSTLTVANGLRIGAAYESGRGEVVVNGNYSRIDVTGNTRIGNAGSAVLRIEDGGRFQSEGLEAGTMSTGSAALVVMGENSIWAANGDARFGSDGQGLLVLADQGVAAVSGNLVFGNVANTGQGSLAVAGGGALIGGNLTQYANSTYSYVIGDGPTVGGGLIVGGTATIADGAQLVVGFDGAVSDGDAYVVLETVGGVTGTYTLVNGGQVSAFLSIDAVYDPTTVTLVVSAQDFAEVAQTPNQIATAEGLQSLGAGDPLYDDILDIATVDEARFAFDQLSGEVHASLKTALIDDSRFLRNAANDRIRAAFGDETGAATPVLAYGPGGPEAGPADTDVLALWGQGFGSWGKWDSDGNAARFSRDTAGMLLGADASLADWRIGLMGGYSHTGVSLPDRASSGSADNYHLGLYGGTQWGNLTFRSGLAYTWHDIDTSRRPAFTGFSENLSGSYDAGTAQTFGEFGYRFDIASRTTLEPFANLAHVRHRTGAFTETGGTAALSAASQTIETTFTTLGLHASHGFTLGTVDVTARGMLGWRHAYGDTTPTSTHAFAGGDAFTVAGVPIGKEAALVEAGLDLTLTPTATLGLSYAGQFASGTTNQAVKANLSVRF